MRIGIILAAFFGLTAVILGAYGSHALGDRLDPYQLVTWQTAVQYHMYHSLAALAVSALAASGRLPFFKTILSLFIAGIVLFSGSLYIIQLTSVKGLGIVTPIGGSLFMLAWLLLIVAALRYRCNNDRLDLDK